MSLLTEAQTRYLAEIIAMPGRRYNGRARGPLMVLAGRGLIEYQMDLRGVGSGRTTEVYTCWPAHVRRDGVDRCICGCKYWDNGRCVDCGGKDVEVEA